MRIGLLYEGTYDAEPLKIITTKIIKEVIPHLTPDFISYEARGPISSALKKAANLFFNIEPYCDFAVFLNDNDKFPERCKKIRKWCTKYCREINSWSKFIVGCPDPTLEQWFFSDIAAIIKVFGLDGSSAIPYEYLHPKQRLQKLYDIKITDPTISMVDIYSDLASEINAEFLSDSNPTFKKFYDDLKKEIDSVVRRGKL